MRQGRLGENMTIHLACILLGALHLTPGRAGAAIGEDPVPGASPLVAEYEALLLGLRAELTAGAPARPGVRCRAPRRMQAR